VIRSGIWQRRSGTGAWYYLDPKPAAANIAGYIAFWIGVKIEL
jgi:uncharacterized protein (DUF427 family)